MARRQTTGLDLSAAEAFTGLVDHGLFSEKIPHCFTSEGLSGHVPAGLLSLTDTDDEKLLKKLLKNRRHDYIRYEAMRETNIPRPLGIPHPESYIVQCLALNRNWARIKKHCARPAKPVSRIFVRKGADKRVFQMNYKGWERFEDEEVDIRAMSGAHYIVRAKPVSRIFVRKGADKRVFQMNYKGWERFEDEEVDIRAMSGAHYIVRADISNCFHSMYTHSIPWAMHGRSKCKRNHSLSLEGNLLDRVAQGTRDGQTNGLLIGPHASNVISELILTKIDRKLVDTYKWYSRHIDDYTFYARTHDEAENFIRDLGMQLRDYELALSGSKTEILPMPLPIEEDWIRELNAFQFPREGTGVRFRTIRAFLDLALRLSHEASTYAVLNYAIKMVPSRLNRRAKRLFTQQAVNLTVLYPYLATIIDEHVFCKHHYVGIKKSIREFAENLLGIGIQRVYSDAIAHSLYIILKYDLQFAITGDDLREKLEEVIAIDDCLSNVLVLEYARRYRIVSIQEKVRGRANELKGLATRESDRHWLLIYQLWRAGTLRKEGQEFLADLKRSRFNFVSFG